MARSRGTVINNDFSKGLITEATGLNFPENAVTDSLNVYFDRKGKVYRRKGIDVESGAETLAYDTSDGVVHEFIWEAVSRTGGFTFLVLQVGSLVHFYQMTTNEALSASIDVVSLDLSDYKAPGSDDITTTACSFASGSGYLFIAHPYCDPVIVRWNEDDKQFEAAKINVFVRDFEGIDDGLKTNENPVTLSDAHHYNLLNQGWNQKVRVGTVSNEAGTGGPLFEYDRPELNWEAL